MILQSPMTGLKSTLLSLILLPGSVAFSQSSDVIELHRGSCYGACPEYTIRIHADSRTEWDGVSNVNDKGSRVGSITRAAAHEVFVRAIAAANDQQSTKAPQKVTDQPVWVVKLQTDKLDRSWEATGESAPQWLKALAFAIDDEADTHRHRHGPPAQEHFGEFNLRQDSAWPKPGRTALMKSAAEGDVKTLSDLLERGANPNETDASGWTALMYATQAPDPSSMKILIAAGADPRMRSGIRQTALMAAVTAVDHPVAKIQLLTAAGADVNDVDAEGVSSLMIAVRSFWRLDVIKELIAGGANGGAHDTSGNSVEDHLRMAERHHPSMQKDGDEALAVIRR